MGAGEAFRYVVVYPRDHGFEARNPGALFVALSRSKSAGGEGRDPDFAFHEDVLINNYRFRPVDTATTRARAVEIETACLSNSVSAEKGVSTSVQGGNLSQTQSGLSLKIIVETCGLSVENNIGSEVKALPRWCLVCSHTNKIALMPMM